MSNEISSFYYLAYCYVTIHFALQTFNIVARLSTKSKPKNVLTYRIAFKPTAAVTAKSINVGGSVGIDFVLM